MGLMRITVFKCLKSMSEYDLKERDEIVSCSYSDVHCLDDTSFWHVTSHNNIRIMVLERDEAN